MMNETLLRQRAGAGAGILAMLVALWSLAELSLQVDEPQFAYRYSRIAFVLGLGAILCVVGGLAAAVWVWFFRADSGR